MVHHRQTCLPLVDPHSHMNIARSAYRFVKIEKVMIKMVDLFLIKMATTLSRNTPTGIATLGNYKEMHFMNAQLLSELKQLLPRVG